MTASSIEPGGAFVSRISPMVSPRAMDATRPKSSAPNHTPLAARDASSLGSDESIAGCRLEECVRAHLQLTVARAFNVSARLQAAAHNRSQHRSIPDTGTG
eukprot:CAMPEP_0174730538 /NCGR_PEP_ID=MMETSP1094-20130205/55808_1 /TAXON_ID=156173 /ORGANISM="Chrysochromulina brevifilum, Strain UTEX LB 985" /LENGTH=100 /DNA_ID=CAMNT_0015932817 /DNA_START=225 /DNA_END=523 /DNA_ORIENTATION=-